MDRFRLRTLVPLFLLSITPALHGEETKKKDKQQEKNNSYNKTVYKLDKDIQKGLPKVENPPHLETPLATVENFIFACREDNFERASWSLNLKRLSPDERAQRGPELAEKLFYVLNQQLWIDWDELPERADGQVDQSMGGKNPLAGVPRRSIRLGTISFRGRIAVIRVQRVELPNQQRVWVFSPNIVDKIEPLYAAYGPSWLNRQLPQWLKVRTIGKVPLWEWVVLLGGIFLGVLLGWGIQRVVRNVAHRSRASWVDGLAYALRFPLACSVGLLVIYLVDLMLLNLTGPVAYIMDPILLILLISSLCWLCLSALNFFTEYVITAYVRGLKDDEQLEVQQMLTRISVGKRLVTLIAVLLAVGIVLVQMNVFKTLGTTLLVSAGLLSVILGIAAQTVLGNLLAGIQIALTQPVRIGDSVVFEGEWGYVEEIAFSYLVIRIWDQRRLVVPLQYFLSHPVENWSKPRQNLIKPIYLYVDYRTDVEAIRQKFDELLRDSEGWDEEVEPQVLVTSVNDETMELRALCSAKDPTTAWYLHCDLREKLIAFLRDLQEGEYLPRRRLAIFQKDGQEQEITSSRSNSTSGQKAVHK